MHELSVASSLVESLTQIAEEKSATKIVEVELKVGKLRLLSLDQLRFSYEILSKDTLLEGSKLRIKETPGSTRCPSCGYAQTIETPDQSYHFGLPQMACPKCGSALVIEGGEECLITKVRMVISQNTMKSATLP